MQRAETVRGKESRRGKGAQIREILIECPGRPASKAQARIDAKLRKHGEV